MPLVKKNSTRKSPKKVIKPKQFVSDDGHYLHDDATGKMLKEWHEMIKNATRLPSKPSTSE